MNNKQNLINDLSTKKIEKLLAVLNVANADYVSVDDFAESLKVFLTLLQDSKQVNETERQKLISEIQTFYSEFESSKDNLGELISSKTDELRGMINSLALKIENIKLQKGDTGEVGPQGPQGETGKDGSPDSAEDIRNKLELLSGDERLDRAYIRGLESVPSQRELEDIKRIAQANAKPITTTHFSKNGTSYGRAKNINIDTTGSAKVSITGDTATIKVTYITVAPTAPENPDLNDLWIQT